MFVAAVVSFVLLSYSFFLINNSTLLSQHLFGTFIFQAKAVLVRLVTQSSKELAQCVSSDIKQELLILIAFKPGKTNLVRFLTFDLGS